MLSCRTVRVVANLCESPRQAKRLEMEGSVREVPREAYNQFQQLRATYTQLAQKIAELDAERGEHEFVTFSI
jgi:hypothetical protein